jgi:hypothetical protein
MTATYPVKIHRETLEMPYDVTLAQRTRDALSRKKGITEKKMFSGIGFLLHGNLLVGVRKDSLLFRIGLELCDEALLEPHVKEFEIKGRGAMKGWIVVGVEGVEEDNQLKDWIGKAMKFVGMLPRK